MWLSLIAIDMLLGAQKGEESEVTFWEREDGKWFGGETMSNFI